MKIPFGSGSLENLWGKAKSAFSGSSGPVSIEKPNATLPSQTTQAKSTTPLDQRFMENLGAMNQGKATQQIPLMAETTASENSHPIPSNPKSTKISATAAAVCPVEEMPPMQTQIAFSNFIAEVQTEEIADIEAGKSVLNSLAQSPHYQAASGQRIEASLKQIQLNDQQVLLDELKIAMKAAQIDIPPNFSLDQISKVFKHLSEPQMSKLLQILTSRDKRMEAEIARLNSMGAQFSSDAFKITDLEKARKMLGPLLKHELPQVLKLKQDYLKFEGQLTTQRQALAEQMRKFARENGLQLPDSLLKTMMDSPFGAEFHLNDWLRSQSAQFAGQPDKLQALRSLKLFGIQLQNVSEILSRVQHKENISADTLNKYVLFQTFITVKDKLFAAYENSTGPQRDKLREAIFNLDQLFSGMEPTPEAFKARLESWLGQYLSPQEIAAALQSLNVNIEEIGRHNERVTEAEQQGIRVPDDPPSLPPVPPTTPTAGEQLAELCETTRQQSEYYRQVYATEGDEGLSRVLRTERETVLRPLAQAGNLDPLSALNEQKATGHKSPISAQVQEALNAQREALLKKLTAGGSTDVVKQQFDKIRNALRQMLHKNQMEFRNMQQKLALQKMLADMMMQMQAELKHLDQSFQTDVRKHSEALLLEMQTEIQKIPVGTGLIQL
ncbi:MAG: hypothetical protein AB7I41_11260 [Candidatus Sericytochromatia bacterium]